MRIVFVSCLPETMSGGPKYSVPHQIDAQSLFDEVYWINMTNVETIDSVIKPSNIFDWKNVVSEIRRLKPQLVIFEDFYYFSFYRIAAKLKRDHIPYIIKPRGSMTCYAQKRRALKKSVANLLFFNSFIRGALAIEYLNDGEMETTAKKWKAVRSIVVPNGIDKKIDDCPCNRFNRKGLKGLFIGRIDVFHKGIDTFLGACSFLRDDLIKRECVFEFYGPCDKADMELIQEYLHEHKLDNIISVHDEVHNERKNELLINSDFFVLTSRFEGMPMGLLEALSYGLPSIVTYGTNMGSEIASCGAGFCSSCDVDGIKNSLIKIISLEKSDLNRMSECAMILASKYNWNEIAKQAHLSYDSLIK